MFNYAKQRNGFELALLGALTQTNSQLTTEHSCLFVSKTNPKQEFDESENQVWRQISPLLYARLKLYHVQKQIDPMSHLVKIYDTRIGCTQCV